MLLLKLFVCVVVARTCFFSFQEKIENYNYYYARVCVCQVCVCVCCAAIINLSTLVHAAASR